MVVIVPAPQGEHLESLPEQGFRKRPSAIVLVQMLVFLFLSPLKLFPLQVPHWDTRVNPLGAAGGGSTLEIGA